ncbi:hypothetical protein HPB47_002798 [Ixodes persulcatus]|uniref:Uncharacterized protein n=1 Tax=Ixodes persulcatus TaxID=34615 RepID=A0AC60QZB3_IXOPE|nr:hypothetical protein HPB47_002798 [Ixodes persulcatus]
MQCWGSNTSHLCVSPACCRLGYSRFAVNSVTSGDYSWPLKISRFVTEMNLGFRLLNLKNDMLRKKFDALKYDLKKVEEVVYDLSIRGLKPSGDAQPPADA